MLTPHLEFATTPPPLPARLALLATRPGLLAVIAPSMHGWARLAATWLQGCSKSGPSMAALAPCLLVVLGSPLC